MTQEEIKLIIKDLGARLAYHPHCDMNGLEMIVDGLKYYDIIGGKTIAEVVCFEANKTWSFQRGVVIKHIKPFLRSKGSMTEEEREWYRGLQSDAWVGGSWTVFDNYRSIDYLNSIHVDFRGLIEKGLALEAPKYMYKHETED